ncbi:MAG: hypothetical protein GWN56_04430 [Nitrosopumilaceae archaeon]|nr:hypothetical protein [Nitrosopumilaceae archaeon]
MKCAIILCRILLFAFFLFIYSEQAQSVNQVTFRVPVEVQNIHYLSSVVVQCKIQDGSLIPPPISRYDWSIQHTIEKLVKKWIWNPNHYPECLVEPRTVLAATSCADASPDGLSWSQVVEVTVRDYESGNIRVDQGVNYKCHTIVQYDIDPETSGEATLSDSNCVGFYNNTWSQTARDKYKTYTSGDIAAASLCVKTGFNSSLDVIEVPPQYIRGGEYIPPAEVSTATPTPTPTPIAAVQKPSVYVQKPSVKMMKQKLPGKTIYQTPADNTTICASAVQDKIAWNYKGDKRWSSVNLNSLCSGAVNTTEPAMCFQKVMHNGVNWGGGTKWVWSNALNLCKGSRNANNTIACFEKAINDGKGWKDAINVCTAKP